ncbi:MAG: hypothetical protein ACUVSL_14680 [Chloroflexus sp.]|uniref:hypothetical protein n=1 Tax=Chloroflexus sp. TaxID=1904827 RepID=UPI00404AA777
MLAHRAVEGSDEITAGLALLAAVPLADRMIGADAAILKTPSVPQVVEQGRLHRAGESRPTGPAGGVGGVDRRPVSATKECAGTSGRGGHGAGTD